MENEPDITDTPQPAPAQEQNPAPAQETAPAPDNVGQPANSIPEYSQEAFDKLNEAYSLNEPQPTSAPETAATDTESSDNNYTLAFPDTFNHPESQAFNTILTPIAKASGMDGAAFGKLFAESYAAIEDARMRAEWQNRFQQDADLKKDWGADYETNMRIARAHSAYIQQKAGLSESDMAVFSSPKGMRALFALASAHASHPAAGLEQQSDTEASWAKAVMQAGHPDHDAFTNPMNPRHKEINQRWLRANGV